MNRLGFEADEEGIALMARLARLPGLELEGIFSHFEVYVSFTTTSNAIQQFRGSWSLLEAF